MKRLLTAGWFVFLLSSGAIETSAMQMAQANSIPTSTDPTYPTDCQIEVL